MAFRMFDIFRFRKKNPRSISPSPPQSSSEWRGVLNSPNNFVINQPVFIENTVSAPALVEALKPKLIRGAGFDSSIRHPLPRCQVGTRTDLMERLISWHNDVERQWVMFWVTGPAGSGKSAIAQTFAEISREALRLGAALFLSRPHHGDDFSLIIPTIVFQLSNQDVVYRQIVDEVLLKDPLILEGDLPALFKNLIHDPAQVLLSKRPAAISTPLVIILDGLDECGDHTAQLELIGLIDSFIRSHGRNSPFLWMICTRPEPHLMKTLAKLESQDDAYCGSTRLLIGDAQSVEDIARVFRTAFDDIRQQYSDTFNLEKWPTEEQLQRLVGVTSGFFLLASGIVQFVGDPERRNPVAQLEVCWNCLNSPYTSKWPNPFATLDAVYQQILSTVQEDTLLVTLDILRLCVLSMDGSDTVQTIQFTLGIDRFAFYRALQDLHSLLRVPSPEKADTEGPQFYHSSFADYLGDENRSGKYCIRTVEESLQSIPSHGGVEASVPLQTVAAHEVVFADTARRPGSDDDAPTVDSNTNTQQTPPGDSDATTGVTFLDPSQSGTPSQHLEVATLLSEVLKASRSRKALLKLRGDPAQLVIDYLQSLLLEPSLSVPWLRKHSLIALRELSKVSSIYPRCYVLKDIIVGPHRDGGAFSDVHEGRYGEQRLCLKIVRLHERSDTEALLKVYAKEAILWGQLRHPNVAPFYGIYYLNEMRERVCLVSPWMKNGNLVNYLKNKPLVPRPPFVYDIVAGLEYLHHQSLVHSDIKGMNILVNDSEQACITDFGLTFIRTDQTLAYTFAGTTKHGFSHHWAAPELLDDDVHPTLASDVWALGMVFYEVLTGSLPYGASTDVQIIRKILRGELPTRPDPKLNSGLTEDAIWKLIYRCWALDPADRPTCQDIIQELQQEGIVRGQDGNLDDTAQHLQSFRDAMIEDEVPVDVDRVKQILNEL